VEKSDSLAYTTIAMNELGYSRREIESITNKMLEIIENLPEKDAEDKADEILYDTP
jgi:Holliday junction resolvasome RuvABC DNA-binding subunit